MRWAPPTTGKESRVSAVKGPYPAVGRLETSDAYLTRERNQSMTATTSLTRDHRLVGVADRAFDRLTEFFLQGTIAILALMAEEAFRRLIEPIFAYLPGTLCAALIIVFALGTVTLAKHAKP